MPRRGLRMAKRWHFCYASTFSLHAVSLPELTELSQQFGLRLLHSNDSENRPRRAGVSWSTAVLGLPDDGLGALPLLLHLVLVDKKSSTYKSRCYRSWRALRAPPTGRRATKPITSRSRWGWSPCSGCACTIRSLKPRCRKCRRRVPARAPASSLTTSRRCGRSIHSNYGSAPSSMARPPSGFLAVLGRSRRSFARCPPNTCAGRRATSRSSRLSRSAAL
jgi:hypothetical protein